MKSFPPIRQTLAPTLSLVALSASLQCSGTGQIKAPSPSVEHPAATATSVTSTPTGSTRSVFHNDLVSSPARAWTFGSADAAVLIDPTCWGAPAYTPCGPPDSCDKCDGAGNCMDIPSYSSNIFCGQSPMYLGSSACSGPVNVDTSNCTGQSDVFVQFGTAQLGIPGCNNNQHWCGDSGRPGGNSPGSATRVELRGVLHNAPGLVEPPPFVGGFADGDEIHADLVLDVGWDQDPSRPDLVPINSLEKVRDYVPPQNILNGANTDLAVNGGVDMKGMKVHFEINGWSSTRHEGGINDGNWWQHVPYGWTYTYGWDWDYPAIRSVVASFVASHPGANAGALQKAINDGTLTSADIGGIDISPYKHPVFWPFDLSVLQSPYVQATGWLWHDGDHVENNGVRYTDHQGNAMHCLHFNAPDSSWAEMHSVDTVKSWPTPPTAHTLIAYTLCGDLDPCSGPIFGCDNRWMTYPAANLSDAIQLQPPSPNASVVSYRYITSNDAVSYSRPSVTNSCNAVSSNWYGFGTLLIDVTWSGGATLANRATPQGLTCGLSYAGALDAACNGYHTLSSGPAPGFSTFRVGDWGTDGYWAQEFVAGTTDPSLATSFVLPKGATCGLHNTRISPGHTCMGFNPGVAFGLEPPPLCSGATSGCPPGWAPMRAFDMSSTFGYWVWCEYQDPNNLSAGSPLVPEGITCGIAMNADSGSSGQCLGEYTNGGRQPACLPGLETSSAWRDDGRSSGSGLGYCATNGGSLPPMRGWTGLTLLPSQSVTSPDGQTTLIYQGDGNLVLYFNGGALGVSNTAGTSPGVATMQADGNLVVYDPNWRPLWASNTSGHWGATLQVQNGGGAVIYDEYGIAIWSAWVPPPCVDPPPCCSIGVDNCGNCDPSC